ncbi:hypothetical protein [Bacteroides sp. 519]|uniref:hypothetical protein n=1 Tax=Bacteroides sp. 519 TaxID=2302937 RepID=UPI0013D65CBD|nr:hypothetical protein [Bacteroides sp. 519]NDV59373.1 hypothetical protein [Bacteroides sp. 519]
MDKIKAIQSVNEIKELMERSSKFVSLSGLTGVLVGIYSLLGAWIVSRVAGIQFINQASYQVALPQEQKLTLVLAVAGGVLLISVVTAFLISYYKSNKVKQKLFNKLTYRIIWNFGIPLFVGGLFCIALLCNQNYGLTSSVMLLFYGLSLVNVAKYTFSNVAWLGYGFLILGLLDAFFEGNGLLFWTIGFGGLHIIYGVLFYLLYEKNK